jgi:hypothetical protein
VDFFAGALTATWPDPHPAAPAQAPNNKANVARRDRDLIIDETSGLRRTEDAASDAGFVQV